jgi:hypothetical protein
LHCSQKATPALVLECDDSLNDLQVNIEVAYKETFTCKYFFLSKSFFKMKGIMSYQIHPHLHKDSKKV